MRILIGNGISLFSSTFLCLGGLARSKKNIYLFQFLECVCIIVSQIVFGQYSGAVSMCFSATRNILASTGKYKLPFMIIIFIGTGVLGVLLNSGGAIGFIPVVATLFLTVTTYFFNDIIKIRGAVIANLVMWIVYSLLILDIVAALTNIIALILNIYIITKDIKAKAK